FGSKKKNTRARMPVFIRVSFKVSTPVWDSLIVRRMKRIPGARKRGNFVLTPASFEPGGAFGKALRDWVVISFPLFRKRFSMSGSYKKALSASAILALSISNTLVLPAFASQPVNTTQQNQNYGYGDRVDRQAYTGHRPVTVHDYMQDHPKIKSATIGAG